MENIIVYKDSDVSVKSTFKKNNKLDSRGIMSISDTTRFHVFTPSSKNVDELPCLFIFPGGGYEKLSMLGEGVEVAQEAIKNGIIAIVVQYRLPKGDFEATIEGFYRLLRMLYQNSSLANIDWSSLHIMGFSAGAHLAGMVSHKVGFASFCKQRKHNWDLSYASNSLIYPVISTSAPYSDQGCVEKLLGERICSTNRYSISLERLNHHSCPHHFVLYTDDDTRILPQNAKDYVLSVEEQGISIFTLRYKNGGHGFGLGRDLEHINGWFCKYVEWLNYVVLKKS